jgi:hypothetical protein
MREGERQVVISSNEARSYGPPGHGVLAQTCVNSCNQEMCPRKYAEGNVMARNNAPECQWPLPSQLIYISKSLNGVVPVRCRGLDIFYVICYSERHIAVTNIIYNGRWRNITKTNVHKVCVLQSFPALEGMALPKWQLLPACGDNVVWTCFILTIIYDVHS